MKPVEKRRPIDHVTPRLSPERVERMWSVVERADAPARARWLWVAAAAVLLLALARAWPSPALTSGDVVTAPTALRLPDGSALQTAEATELRVVHAEPAEIELALTHGRLRCEVSHRARRRFAVRVGELTVLVRGTVFSVEAQADDIRVEVERGLVEVRMREVLLASLAAGQSFRQRGTGADAPSAEALPAEAGDAAAAPAVPEGDSPEVRTREERAGTHERGARASQRSVRSPGARTTTTSPTTTTAAPVAAREPAEALLERANDARLAGDARGAANLYQELQRAYPDDPRAGLSAFELARISVHTLHDPARALAALRFARAHGHGFAREDAEVLEIEALALSGDGERCAAARARFVRAYPDSAQRARVEHACD